MKMIFDKLVIPAIALNDLRAAIQNVAGAKKRWGAITAAEATVSHLQTPDTKARSMKDSFTHCVVPLTNLDQRERYMNYLKQIRVGRLLEDLDSFAVFLGYKHTNMIDTQNKQTQKAGFSIVTAGVDRIFVRGQVLPNADLHFTGFVSWVGRSSMEVTMNVEQQQGEEKKHILDARFVMVAIDAVKRTSMPVTPMAPPSDTEEKAVFDHGVHNHKRRIAYSNKSLFRKAPDSEESMLIHDLYLSTLDPNQHSFKDRLKPSDDVWMRDTSMKSLIICQPENRNIYGKIFGGFLMRTAYELAWAEAWTFSRARPQCVAVDDIVFRRPVEVGSLLYLHQSIGYTEDDLVQARVTTEVTDLNDPSRRELSNIFHFTFRTPLQPGRPPLPRIIPDSYGESMLWLDSRRRLLASKEEVATSLEQA